MSGEGNSERDPTAAGDLSMKTCVLTMSYITSKVDLNINIIKNSHFPSQAADVTSKIKDRIILHINYDQGRFMDLVEFDPGDLSNGIGIGDNYSPGK